MEQNIIEYNDFAAGVTVRVPAPHRTEVSGLVKPVTKFGKRLSRHKEAAADLRKATAALERVTQAIQDEAAEAAKSDRPVESKKLVKRQRAAEDGVAEARIDQVAATTAMRAAYAEVIEAVARHRPALRAEAIVNLDADMLSLATILSRLREVLDNVEEHVGVLGMVDTFDATPRPVLRSTTEGGRVPLHVSSAVQELVGAIGAISEVLDIARGAGAAKSHDVEVPLVEAEAAESGAPATPADDNAIVASPDTEGDE